MKKFSINLYCEDLANRPKVSYLVREYIEDFVIQKVLEKKKVIVNSKWNIVLAISFLERDYNQDSIDIMPPRVFSDINIKQYTVVVPYEKRLQQGNKSVEFGKYLFEITSAFLLDTYKKITESELKELQENLDINFLSDISYPASFIEQKYIDDNDPNVIKSYQEIYDS